MRRLLAVVLAVAAVVAGGSSQRLAAIVGAPRVVGSFGRIDAGGLIGHVGIDVDDAFGYELVQYWDESGRIDDVTIPGSPSWVRFEFYPDSHAYDPWTLDVGGVHVHRDPSMGTDWLSLGDVTLPRLGESFAGAVGFRIDGSIVSTTDVPDGRVEIDAFQLGFVEYDPFIPPLPRNASGVELGSFATSLNRGRAWTAGVGWPGRYVLFIRDTATDRHVQAVADIAPGRVPTIDLDAVCFGFYTCQYDLGGPGAVAGGFHPLPPTRVLDTRARLGITNGPVRTGGGWSDDARRAVRYDEAVNHELKVTGRYGVPTTGVSAVLVSVVAVDAPGPGYVAVRPRRASCCSALAIHDDRSAMDPTAPATSNLNVAGADAVANLVLARVGAGGTINLYNSFGPTHVVADIAGWFDTGSPDAGGYVGVGATRVLDTRDGTGGPARRLDPGETRTVDVRGVPGVPDDVASVVLNVTATQAAGNGYARAFASGAATPTTSVLNFTTADRANLAVVPVGSDGRIAVRVDDASTHLVVDVVGAFAPGGARTTAIEPFRAADSRAGVGVARRKLGDGDVATVHVAGVGSVPANAVGVVANVTVTQTEGAGFATVFPGATPPPPTSNLNFTTGPDVPNLAITSLGPNGSISVQVRGARAHVVVDVLGYLTP